MYELNYDSFYMKFSQNTLSTELYQKLQAMPLNGEACET